MAACASRMAPRLAARAWLVLAGLGWAAGPLAAAAAAPPSAALVQWRGQLEAARALAENQVRPAYEQAVRLQAAPPLDATPADRNRSLTLLARTELYLAMTEAAGIHAEQALESARLGDDRVGQAEADLVLTLNTVNQGRVERLIEASKHALKILDGVPQPALQVEAMLRAAMMYSRFGQLDESVQICVQAMETARVSAVPLALAYAHQCMAISFAQSENPQQALQHYVAMAAAARQTGSRLVLAQAIAGQAGQIAVRDGYPSGESMMRDALQIYGEVGAPFFVINATSGVANNLSHQGRHREALQLMNAVVTGYERYPNRIGMWWALMGRAAEYQALGNATAAWSDVERAYQLAREVGLDGYVGTSARQLGELAARRGNYQAAYAYGREAARLAAQSARDKLGKRVIELTEHFESETKQRHIDALTLSNTRQQAELERQVLRQRWLWTVLGGILTLTAFTAAFAVRLRRSHRLVRKLNARLELTVQRRTAQLRQQTRYLRVLIDTLPGWVWFKDTDSRYLAVNRAVADTWGCEVDAIVGLADEDITPAMAAQFRAEDREVMATRQARTVEAPHQGGHGARWVETFKAPVLDDDGSVLGTVGFARDISERKQADRAREAALAEAQRLAQLRSDFLAQMSHELRTPLNAILGYAQLLRRDAALNETQRTGVDVIHDSGHHLLTMINDLLDSVKIEASKLELRSTPVALRQCLQALADMVRVKAGQKELRFSCQIEDGVPAMVLADEQRLRQALLNLLANAVKFTDRGSVSLTVRALPGERVGFEVADTGVGIEADQLERIFLPFEQAGEAQRRHGGTGLGLAISRQFVRLLGGEIAVESQPGQGCRFWFELVLPALDVAAPATRPQRQIVGYHGPRRQLLVADDGAGNRRLLAAMLVPLGFQVEQAGHGQAVLDQVARRRPDLILMDVAMPGMDGLEATRRLRGQAALAGLPVIAISASASDADREHQRLAGIDASLAKPVELDLLLAQIGALLGLDWQWQPLPPQGGGDEGGQVLVTPPPDEMAVLHRLVQLGNMRDIQQRAAHLAQLDPRYRPFAAQLQRLAKGFQSLALLQLVEHHLALRAGAEHAQ